jgi:hypothetical protein
MFDLTIAVKMKLSGPCMRTIRTVKTCVSASCATTDVHSSHRKFAQALSMQQAPVREDLPPPFGRPKRQDYDHIAVKHVILAMIHNYVDIILWHYIQIT